MSQIGKEAFRETGLVEIIIPASIEVLDGWCFLIVDQFPLLHLNQGRNRWELKRRLSIKLGGLTKLNKLHNYQSDLDRDWQIGISVISGYFRSILTIVDFISHVWLTV
jgi:hypothetical protein